jgi:hypothetical protein
MNEQTNQIHQLVAILEDELAEVEKMTAAARRQNDALRRNDGEKLLEATGELELLARALKALQAARSEVQARVGRDCGLPPGTPLAEVVAALPLVPVARQAAHLEAGLREKARELAELIRLNNLLAQNGLRFCSLLLRAVDPSRTRTYLPDGAVSKDGANPPLLDKSV